jgi:hypothetical protein
MGAAVPFVISAHTHPQIPKLARPAPGTGIDYLGPVLDASEDAIPGAIHYRHFGDHYDEETWGGQP